MDVKLQFGGSDQWGNIVNGVELARRCDQQTVFGFTAPLLTTSDGKKMGKTADGAVWLNEELLSSFDYWQFWRNTADADVGRFLRIFTELPQVHPTGCKPRLPDALAVPLPDHPAVRPPPHPTHNGAHARAALTRSTRSPPYPDGAPVPSATLASPQDRIEELEQLQGAAINDAKVILADEVQPKV